MDYFYLSFITLLSGVLWWVSGALIKSLEEQKELLQEKKQMLELLNEQQDLLKESNQSIRKLKKRLDVKFRTIFIN